MQDIFYPKHNHFKTKHNKNQYKINKLYIEFYLSLNLNETYP